MFQRTFRNEESDIQLLICCLKVATKPDYVQGTAHGRRRLSIEDGVGSTQSPWCPPAYLQTGLLHYLRSKNPILRLLLLSFCGKQSYCNSILSINKINPDSTHPQFQLFTIYCKIFNMITLRQHTQIYNHQH